MRGGFCSGSTRASGQLGDSRAQGPDDQLRLLRRKKELLRRGYSGGQGTTEKTNWHSDMHGRCDVGVRSRWHLGGSRLQRGEIGRASCRERVERWVAAGGVEMRGQREVSGGRG